MGLQIKEGRAARRAKLKHYRTKEQLYTVVVVCVEDDVRGSIVMVNVGWMVPETWAGDFPESRLGV